MKYIFILARTLDKYHQGVQHTLPGLERYHGIKFNKKGQDYVSDKYVIKPALRREQVLGFYNWQLIKFADYWENPEAVEIEQEHQIDIARRKAPSVGQD